MNYPDDFKNKVVPKSNWRHDPILHHRLSWNGGKYFCEAGCDIECEPNLHPLQSWLEQGSLHGHTMGKPYQNGYATCSQCGARENTDAMLKDCRNLQTLPQPPQKREEFICVAHGICPKDNSGCRPLILEQKREEMIKECLDMWDKEADRVLGKPDPQPKAKWDWEKAFDEKFKDLSHTGCDPEKLGIACGTVKVDVKSFIHQAIKQAREGYKYNKLYVTDGKEIKEIPKATEKDIQKLIEEARLEERQRVLEILEGMKPVIVEMPYPEKQYDVVVVKILSEAIKNLKTNPTGK